MLIFLKNQKYESKIYKNVKIRTFKSIRSDIFIFDKNQGFESLKTLYNKILRYKHY